MCQQAIAEATRIAFEVLRPRAEAADRAFAPDEDSFRALSDAGLAGLTVRTEYGGPGAPAEVAREVGEILGGACGCTFFTFHQHWSAVGLIQQGDNEELKRRVLPELARGLWTGVGFSHLRRPGPPCVRAEEVDDGFALTGLIPWFSGWPLYRHGVLAAKMSDGRELFLFTPIAECATLRVGSPMALCAMQGSGTVELALDGYFVPRANICFVGEPHWLRTRDGTNITLHAHNPLIVAAASVSLLREIARKKPSVAIDDTTAALARNLQHVRAQVDFWSRDENRGRPDYTPGALAARTSSILLAIRAASACVVASAGAANLCAHPAQRYFREAMFYSIQGQTPEVMAATLTALGNTNCSNAKRLHG